MTQYWSNFGPYDEPLISREHPPTIGVFEASTLTDRTQEHIGIAFPDGCASYKRVVATTFRLMIGKEELAGRWVCDARQFVRVRGEAED